MSNTRKNIIRTSLKLFSEYGYDTVTMKEIAFETSLTRTELRKHFTGKAEIVTAILELIPEALVHFYPTMEDVRLALEENTPEELLMRYVSMCFWREDPLRLQIHRFLYMEQYRQDRIRQAALKHLIQEPVRSIAHTLDLFVELGAVPPCDSRAIAEIWCRTSLVFCMQDAHRDISIDIGEYREAMRFIVRLVVKGVCPMSVEQMELAWSNQPFGAELAFNGGVPERILFTAFDLFSEHGYRNVSIRLIADVMGISTGTLYHYYATKAEILQRIGEMLLDRYAQYSWDNPAFEGVVKQRDPVKIALMLGSSYPPVKEGYMLRLYRILFREQYLNETIKDVFVGGIYREIDAVRKLLDELAAQGRIPPLDSRNHAIVYVHTMCSFTVGATVFPKDVEDLDALRLRVVALLTSFVVNGFVKERVMS